MPLAEKVSNDDLDKIAWQLMRTPSGEATPFTETGMTDGVYKLLEGKISAVLAVINGRVFYVNNNFVTSQADIWQTYIGQTVYKADATGVDLSMLPNFDDMLVPGDRQQTTVESE